MDADEPGNLVPLTVEEDLSLPSISINGTLLHAETFGNQNDPLLVIIHGGPGTDYRSMLNCSDFANDGFYVVFYDQRGSGLSQRPKNPNYTPQLFIDDLDAVISHFHKSVDQKIFLYGHSWGAMLAAAYIDQNLDAISGVILTEPGGFTWEDTEAYINRWRKIEFFDETTNDLVYLDQFITADSDEMLDYKASLVNTDHLVGNVGPTPFWRMGARCNQKTIEYAMEHGFDFTTNLHQYVTKVLFGYSELNNAYGQKHAEKVSSAFPNFELVEIKGTGHDIPYFGWENFYPLAKAYLNELK
ncbi:alpha/beta fold hydrolase [candidate division KSB1 bacterium]|nr:alpha/beta fold hydrolase [candidate division KSB1 bacterium]